MTKYLSVSRILIPGKEKAMKQHRIGRRLGIGALLCVMLLSVATSLYVSRQHAYAASAVTINGGTTYQTIDGFGFSAAFGQAGAIEGLPSGPQKQILDLLFSPTTGAGFTILRNLLPSDSG